MAVGGMIEKIYDKGLREQVAETAARQALLTAPPRANAELIKQAAGEILQLIREGLVQDGLVRIHNFGTFRMKMSKARRGYNPHTKQIMEIPARPRVVFTPAKALREILNAPPMPMEKFEKQQQRIQTPKVITTGHDNAAIKVTAADSVHRIESAAITANDVSTLSKQTERVISEKSDVKPAVAALSRHQDVEDKQFGRWTTLIVVVCLIGLLIWMFPRQQTAQQAVPQNSIITQTASEVTEPVVMQNHNAPVTDEIAETIAQEMSDQTAVVQEAPVLEVEQAPAVENISDDKEIAITQFFHETEHLVAKGDTLWKLAQRFYENPYFWPQIYQSNHDLITNPDRIEVNELITLPKLIGPPSDLTPQDRERIAQGYFLLYEYYKKTSYEHPHYALVGVKWFDEGVLRQNDDKIETIDKQKLNAKRRDNELIAEAFMRNSKRAIK